MVDGALASRAAMARIDSPSTRQREISSRSTKLIANLERRRAGGRIPPVSAKILWTDE
jgi:hypothetical protein